MNSIPVSQLRVVFKELKKLDGDSWFRSGKFSVFGSFTHRYNFFSRLTESEITTFEKRHQIQLPVDYRNFLKEFGNGGAGPAYGLLRLQDWHQELEIDSPNFLTTPFPYTTQWNLLRPSDDEESEEFYETEEFKKWEDEYFSNKHITGSIRLSHYGCAIYFILVVTGKEKGNVWVDDRANDNGLYPALSSKTKQKMSFTEWYNEWLQESIENCLR